MYIQIPLNKRKTNKELPHFNDLYSDSKHEVFRLSPCAMLLCNGWYLGLAGGRPDRANLPAPFNGDQLILPPDHL